MTMNPTVETTPLMEAGLDAIQEASRHLEAAGIEYEVSVAGDGVPGS